ncbi:hypothetical protein PM10SUCC1_04980 [Propionigenium maris DSM 9537]|uniref:OmpA-like domain-containing protein n=2 Tax=Propionigenium TaxID=2332 RepID=A0A9W6GGT3_9FUSO|nr:hypothetical protein PM10SUCC1_04980 [Propionigenium maris DSM 9537]
MVVSNRVSLPSLERSSLIEKLLTFDSNLGSFDLNKGSIVDSTITSDIVAERVVERIRGRKGMLRVVGHTDKTGPEEYNISLSYRRASSVADLIMELMPEDLEVRTEISGKGWSEPVAANDTEENRRKNRRVEVYFLEEGTK